MMRNYTGLFWLCLSSLSFAGVDTTNINEKELYFGEAFYYAHQEKYIDAITRLDIGAGRFYTHDKPNPDPLHFQLRSASFSLGDFELSYRMPQRAGRAIKAIIENTADPMVRNEATYRLARIFLKKGEPENAQQAIEQISGKISGDIREDALFLRAQIW